MTRQIMMLNREVRRVPLDFDAPLDKTWEPLVNPYRFPDCTACGHTGYSPTARQIAETFYALHLNRDADREVYRWDDKITQDEVDHLLSEGRLRTRRDGAWHSDPRTADEINALQRTGPMAHDGINRMILIRYRCERLGITVECPVCHGHGDIATEEERDAADNWEPPKVPEGPGWQMWQTTSEGGPISPVFETAHDLAVWLSANERTVGGTYRSVTEWQQIIDGSAIAFDIHTGDLA